ncbi:potassium channel family protein [Nocardia kruczakiae]|uniref:potassium channel family protein n=1 Tax=Nocardia kruczakiae TaxID=261477 RepID=UPI0007A37C06|nr:potassium channel family protein [Nocardia kruczakiae]
MDPRIQGSGGGDARRRAVVYAAARTTLTTIVLVALYFVLPLRHLNELGPILGLCGGLVVVVVLIVRQATRIVAAPYPGLRGAEALTMIAVAFILMFATTYVLMSAAEPDSFSALLTRIDALYFTVTVLGTVGFGDIAATSQAARVVVTVQILADLALIGAGVRVLLAAIQRGRAAREPE